MLQIWLTIGLRPWPRGSQAPAGQVAGWIGHAVHGDGIRIEIVRDICTPTHWAPGSRRLASTAEGTTFVNSCGVRIPRPFIVRKEEPLAAQKRLGTQRTAESAAETAAMVLGEIHRGIGERLRAEVKGRVVVGPAIGLADGVVVSSTCTRTRGIGSSRAWSPSESGRRRSY